MARTHGKDEGHCLPRCLLICKLVHGKRSVGGQKRRWNDELVGDMKSCDLLDDWREIARDRVPGDVR